MGFLLKERPWSQDASVLIEDVCRGRRIGSDACLAGTEDITADLQDFRTNLSTFELYDYRVLAQELTHAVEATARNFNPGDTEAEVAGHLAHRMLRHQIEPVLLQAMADGQSRRYRHWCYGTDQIERHCIISTVGRRRGLYAGICRTVCIGAPSDELVETHNLATFVQSAGILFSQPGWSMDQTWKRVARIYEKFGVPDEWRVADQAEVLGYKFPEHPFRPDSDRVFRPQMPVYWHPSVRSACVGDTMLVGETGTEILTRSDTWPTFSVSVKGIAMDRPAILIREPGH
jgi:Xaa-Pro aminopeptidase